MADLPAGTGFGTLVHAVLETVDPTAADLHDELTRCATDTLRRRPTAGIEPAVLADALVPVLETPLGPAGDAWRLRDVAPADRLTEMDFELPLVGGDEPAATVSLRDVEALLRRHLPADDPLHAYPDALAAIGAEPCAATSRAASTRSCASPAVEASAATGMMTATSSSTTRPTGSARSAPPAPSCSRRRTTARRPCAPR